MHLQKSTSYPSPHVNPRPVGRAYSVNVDRGPLGHLSAKFDRYDVRVHCSGRWNDATRQWKGLKARDADRAGSNSSKTAFRALGYIRIPARVWCKENPHHPPRAPLALQEYSPPTARVLALRGVSASTSSDVNLKLK